jgi:NADH-quinone oxidoreductase subunit N
VTAPLIWIVLPGIYASILLFLRRKERTVVILGILISLLLALFAWTSPIGETLSLGPWNVKLEDTLTVLGRRFILNPSDAPVLTLIYLGLAFWYGGSIFARVNRLFVPIGLGIAALLTSAIAVEPFLYAALIIELVTIISIPLFSPPGRPVGRGVLRYLTFQTLAMPLILFTGWILEGVGASPADSVLVIHGNVLLALGFAFLLAVFPFHTWVPMLAEETHPYVAAFMFYILSLVITLFGIDFLERYIWLRNSPGTRELIRLGGMLMVLVGGLWVAFQRHLGRMLGFAVIVETGLSLLAVSTGLAGEQLSNSLSILFSSLLPRGLAFGLWALALSALTNNADRPATLQEALHFSALKGKGRQFSIATGVLILAIFSLAGFPLLAGFPVRLTLWEALAKQSPLAAAVALLACLGLLVGGIRALVVLITDTEALQWEVTEQWGERVLLVLGGSGLLMIGLFPQWFLPALAHMAAVFIGGQP